MKRLLILVEGQTEERFVKQVLQPHLWTRNLHLEPIILTTKRVVTGPNFKGGIGSYEQVRRDLNRLLGDTSASLVTTLFDLYGLPKDWPDYSLANVHGAKRAVQLQEALERSMKGPSYLCAFLMVHEYEAMLYCQPEVSARALLNPGIAADLASERAAVPSPEDINDGPDTHPSRRILALCPSYRKGIDGPRIVERIGLDAIRQQCPHFNQWVSRLEAV